MKRFTVSLSMVIGLMLSSCGGEKIDGAALAKEICECSSKANNLPADDPNREAEQKKCSELQSSNWMKVKGNPDQEKAFNDQFPCGF